MYCNYYLLLKNSVKKFIKNFNFSHGYSLEFYNLRFIDNSYKKAKVLFVIFDKNYNLVKEFYLHFYFDQISYSYIHNF